MRRWRERAVDGVDRVARLAETVLQPGFIGAVRSGRPVSVAGRRLVGALAAEGIAPDLVLDVGANRGQFAAAALHRWPDATVVAFEPLAEPAERLASIRNPRLTVHQVALGSVDGTLTIHQHAYSLMSSALPLTGDAGTEDSTLVTVPQHRLDSLVGLAQVATGTTLLKLDVQGYELEVLAGAGATLPHVDAVVVEQAFHRTYDGQPLFGEVHDELVGAGFSLAQLLDWRRHAGRVVEVDGLYRRVDPTPR